MVEYILIAVLGVLVWVMMGQIEKLEKQVAYLSLATVALLPEMEGKSDPVAGFNLLARKIEAVFGGK